MILGQPEDVSVINEGTSSGNGNSSQTTNTASNGGSGFSDLKLVGFSDASFAPFGSKSYGASLVVVEDSPVAWRCGKQGYVMLSIMESELYQATEAAVLIESIAALLDEIAGLYVPRKLCVDNTAAVAMATEVQEAGARDTYVSGRSA